MALDDCLYASQDTHPAALSGHYGISRLPEMEGDKPRRKKFDTYPIGFLHIELAA